MQNESTHLRSLHDVRSALLDLLPPLDAAAPPCCAAPNPSMPPALRRPARAPPTLTPSRVRSACRANAAPLAPLHAVPSAPRSLAARRPAPRRLGDGEGAVTEEVGGTVEGRAALEMGKGRSQRSKVEGGWDPVGGADTGRFVSEK